MINFSVLLSVYFKENPSNLKKAFDSIFNQETKASEVVLVEDGPLTIELEKVIDYYEKKYPHLLKLVPLKQNMGLGKALNYGLKQCSNDLVARMDTDDIALPNRFTKQLCFMQNNPEIDVLGSWMKEFDTITDEIYGGRILPEKHNDIVDYMKSRNGMSHPSVMYRKSRIIEAGSYLDFPLYEDYHLWIRSIKQGLKFHNLQEYLMLFRSGEEMIKRRGGWRYLKTEFKFQIWLKDQDIINSYRFIINMVKRMIIRLSGKKMRYFMYRRFLRVKIE